MKYLLVVAALLLCVEVGAVTNPVMWILVHHSLKAAREDPIVSPGQVSSHAHSFVGANGVSATTTTASSLEEASTCTTAGLTADMSAYWAPSLYSYNADNDTFTPRPLDYVNTYYLGRGSAPLVAFPRGLQMLAGNATRRGPGPNYQADDAVSFVCLNYADGSSQSPTLPERSCPQGLRTQVIFPSCWNGQDLVSKNHTHVVYPIGDISQGSCPDSNPMRLPTLFYEFVWGVGSTNNAGNSSWVLSNGDALGYSFHADFISAWDESVLQQALDECRGALFNDLESCPPLAKTLDRKKSQECRAQSSEATSGNIESLPGCNVVWNGPHAGKGLAEGCDPNKLMLKPANWPATSSTSTTTSTSTSTSATSTSATLTQKATQAVVAAPSQSAKTNATPKAQPKPTFKSKPQPKPKPAQAGEKAKEQEQEAEQEAARQVARAQTLEPELEPTEPPQ